MPKKKDIKFDFSNQTSPPFSTAPYSGCGPLSGGAWWQASRNGNLPSDSEGKGWSGVVYRTTEAKGAMVCAPEPPFRTNDGGNTKKKPKEESAKKSATKKSATSKSVAKKSTAKKANNTVSKKAPAKKAPARKTAVKKSTAKKVTTKKTTARKAATKKVAARKKTR